MKQCPTGQAQASTKSDPPIGKRRSPLLPRGFAALMMLTMLGLPSVAGAQVVCEQLGETLTEHSCFHAQYGPWETVVASPGAAANDSTANVDAVHTQWLIRLGDEPSAVSYRPQRSGQWAMFTEPPGLVEVRNPGGEVASQVLDSRATGCRFFGRVQAFQLQAGLRYSVVFDGERAGTDEVVVVIEKIDDFEVVSGRDRDGDGYGDAEDIQVTACAPPAGYVTNDADCNDNDGEVAPGVEDVCDGVDNDCDGLVDNPRRGCGEGEGRCALEGDFICEGQDRVCVLRNPQAEPLSPTAETCNAVDDDCDGTIDNSASNLCDEESDAPACVELPTETRCGCTDDAQCGGQSSGRYCDRTTNRCAEGCFAYAERNGCPGGEVCDTIAPAAPGQCVDECDVAPVPDTCEGGEAEPAALEPLLPAESTGGCGCRIARSTRGLGSGWYGLGFGLPLALALFRRRTARGPLCRRAAVARLSRKRGKA